MIQGEHFTNPKNEPRQTTKSAQYLQEMIKDQTLNAALNMRLRKGFSV